MNRPVCFILLLSVVSFSACTGNHNSQHNVSPYAGEENREIKGLTNQEVKGYLNGHGLGQSKVAELNHYPGPKHVLELSDELELSDDQYQQTKNFFNQMNSQATKIGEVYIEKERALNILFEDEKVSILKVDSLLSKIGTLKGKLRAIHVKAHIKMKKVLTSEQIKKYDELRGYKNGPHSTQHQNHSHGAQS